MRAKTINEDFTLKGPDFSNFPDKEKYPLEFYRHVIETYPWENIEFSNIEISNGNLTFETVKFHDKEFYNKWGEERRHTVGRKLPYNEMKFLFDGKELVRHDEKTDNYDLIKIRKLEDFIYAITGIDNEEIRYYDRDWREFKEKLD